ncbi:MAG: hypothetical protein WCT02_03405 [Candidatus Paceibacterota bacterium]|jgi:hypothetical protein
MYIQPTFLKRNPQAKEVNQWLCIAFLGVWCFWIVLFYLTQKVDNALQPYSTGVASAQGRE